jgi:hypothetical protein
MKLKYIFLLLLIPFILSAQESERWETPPHLAIQHVLLEESYVKNFDEMETVEMADEPSIMLDNFIDIEELNRQLIAQGETPVKLSDKSDYRYRIYGADGFYAYKMRRRRTEAKDNSWHEMQNGYIRIEDRKVNFDEYLPDVVDPHNIKDAVRIRWIRDRISICDTAGVIGEFYCSEWDTTLMHSFRDSIPSYRLSDIVLAVLDSSQVKKYDYSLISSNNVDKISTQNWKQLEKIYWLWDEQMVYPENLETQTKVKDLARIKLIEK